MIVLPDGANRYWVVSPLLDMFPLILRRPPLVGMRLLPPSRDLPAGISLDEVEMVDGDGEFGGFSAEELDQYEAEARVLAEAAAPPVAPTVSPAVDGEVASIYKGAIPDEGRFWIVAVPPPGSTLKVGDVLNVPTGIVLESSSAYIRVQGVEQKVYCKYIEASERRQVVTGLMDGFRKTEASGDLKMPGVADDARTLPIAHRALTGERHLASDVGTNSMSEQQFDDWPVEGPRTTKWLCTGMVRSSPTPTSRHHRWVRDAEIPASDRSRYEHAILSEIIEKAVSYDALQISNLASFEVLSRRLRHR